MTLKIMNNPALPLFPASLLLVCLDVHRTLLMPLCHHILVNTINSSLTHELRTHFSSLELLLVRCLVSAILNATNAIVNGTNAVP